MKKIFLYASLFSSFSVNAQNVGIGTSVPQGKLQINQRSTGDPGLLMVDSFANGVGRIRFRQLNRTVGLNIGGYSVSNFNTDNYLDLYSDSAFIATFRGNGYIGVRNGGPEYPLDVNGDINTTTTLRVNGNAGNSGQVLRSNGNGMMAWDDMCEYKNFISLQSVAADFWTVPAGVTKILIEGWGAGGGGNLFAGGGGGAYVKAYFTVTPGDNIIYNTGDNGAGAVSASATNGGATAFQVGTVTITVGGGQGALYISATNGQAGAGGGFSIPAGFKNYIGMNGASGQSQERNYFPFNSTTYYESGKAGRGGNAANSHETGGLGQTYLYNTTGSVLVFRNGNSSTGIMPGGGGASGVQYGVTTLGGGNGGDGLLIIRY